MRPKRIAVALSAALVVAVVIAVIAIQSDPDEPIASTPSEITDTTSTSTSATSASTPTSTSTSTSASSSSSTSTSVPPEAAVVASVDLAAAVPRLEPQLIASYPIVAPGDLFPTAYATTASGDRLVLLDAVTGVVRFVDGKGMEITQYPTALPTIGSEVIIAGFFAVGPDDILYISEGRFDGSAMVVAYGRTGDAYVEVARGSQPNRDQRFELGRAGVMAIGETEPAMRYVGPDGQPSGATLDVDDLAISSERNVYFVQRGGHTWTVTYVFPPDSGLPPSDRCVLCASAFRGPGDTVVLVNKSPAAGGDLQTKLTVLSDQINTYDVDWDYIGVLGTKMVFARLDQDSIDLGAVEI